MNNGIGIMSGVSLGAGGLGGLMNGAGRAFADSPGGGMAFLVGELEKRDTKLREPLSSVTWQRDITAKTGGGWVDYTSTVFVDYASPGSNQGGIITNSSTAIPVVQADMGKDIFKVFTWANILRVPWVDQAKMQQIGRSLDDILDKGIRLSHNKVLDYNVYLGLTDGTPGLMNNPNLIATLAPNTGTGSSTKWKDKTHDQILLEFNQILTVVWENCEYDLSGMPNQVNLPPAVFSDLVSRKVSEAGNISVLKYLLENNIAQQQGIDLQIVPSRWCNESGIGGTSRALVYRNDEDKVYFDLTVALTRIATQLSVEHLAYLTAYASQIGQVKFTYTDTAAYYDGV